MSPALTASNRATLASDPPDDFVRTGFRVPLIIVSPFAKPHYVSHTPMDYTAV
jgi:phospholipase C